MEAETEKQFIEFVVHVFTLQWAIWALPLSLLLSLIVDRLVPTVVVSLLAVAVHHFGAVALPLLASGDLGAFPGKLSAAAQTLEPLSLLAEFVAYLFLIFVFSQTRQDMFRTKPTN
jgi:hypothetical protein